MQLESEQQELLAKFVEGHRNAPRESRGVFIASQTHNQPQATFLHSRVHGLKFQGSMSDAEVLAHAGLLHMSFGSRGDPKFSVLPQGIAEYERMKTLSHPLDVVSAEPQKFISDPQFKTAHGSAFAKWHQAAELLWSADSTVHLTTIGHLCREALQEFAASMARKHGVDVSAIEPAKTVGRLKAIIAGRSTAATREAFLSALITYWGTVSDLVQRQEHGAQREGEPLVWEDARCIVFQTCIVMFEISRGVR